MTSLIKDVLFPSAAAIGLLAAAIVDPASADESTFEEPAAVVAAAPILASVPAATVSKHVTVEAAQPSVARGGNEAARSNGIERRCERTDRIGKFKISRCD